MTTPTVATGAAIWAVATRICALDPSGFPLSGNNSFTTDRLVKATLTPVLETGDDIVIKTAAGDLGAWGRHGDMPKYGTLMIELATPNPELEQILVGGTQYNDTSTALGVPSGMTATPQTTLGLLTAGVYGYRATQYNSYGESAPLAEVTATVTGSTGAVVLSAPTLAATALGWRAYGRQPGGEQLIGQVPAIGTATTSAAVSAGSPTALSVVALTKPIPAGTSFTLAADTNSPKIVFTTTAEVGAGAVSVPVSVSQSVTTTIASGTTFVTVFVDTGAVAPNGTLPTTDMTAGPGLSVGYQMPALGAIGNQNGVSIEFFSKRMIRGYQATDYPYYRWVLPRVTAMHTLPRDFTNANVQTQIEGQSYENPNWGSGPFADWQFDSSKMIQRSVMGAQILPSPSPVAVQATY